MAAIWIVVKGVWSDDLKLLLAKEQKERSMSQSNLMTKILTPRDYGTSEQKGTKAIL